MRALEISVDLNGDDLRLSPRMIFILILNATILGGSFLSLLFQAEWFPFSPYSMYSYLKPRNSAQFLHLVALNTAQNEVKIPIAKVFWPLHQEAFYASLSAQLKMGQDSKMVLRGLWERYQANRKNPSQNSDLVGLRLYRKKINFTESGFELQDNLLLGEYLAP